MNTFHVKQLARLILAFNIMLSPCLACDPFGGDDTADLKCGAIGTEMEGLPIGSSDNDNPSNFKRYPDTLPEDMPTLHGQGCHFSYECPADSNCIDQNGFGVCQ